MGRGAAKIRCSVEYKSIPKYILLLLLLHTCRPVRWQQLAWPEEHTSLLCLCCTGLTELPIGILCSVCLQLSTRVIEVGDRQAERLQWAAHAVTPSSHFLEYIPGRDQLWTPEALKAGTPLSCAVLCCLQ